MFTFTGVRRHIASQEQKDASFIFTIASDNGSSLGARTLPHKQMNEIFKEAI
jgi:hypothetical protein